MLSSKKTSLLGILGAILMVLTGAVNNRANGGPALTAGNLVPAVVIAAIGAAAKDHDK